MSGSLAGQFEDDWKKHLSSQDKLLSAARMGNWLSVANTAIQYYAIRRGAQDTVTAIRETANQQKWEARENAQRILDGLDDLGDRIDVSIHRLGRMLDDRLALVCDQLQVATAVSKDILAILHVPEFQKERRYYYEQGLRHYANARLDDSLCADALRNFLEAETRDPSDPQVLYRIGLLYLYALPQCNLGLAQAYLARAGKYAFIAAHPDAARAAGVLELVDRGTRELREHQTFAATVLADLSVAMLAQGQPAEALSAIERAIGLDPGHLPARVQHLRALCASLGAGLQDATLALLDQHPETAAALMAEDLLSHAGVQTALQIHLRRQIDLDQRALADLLKRMGNVDAPLKALAGQPLLEAAKLLQQWRAAPPERQGEVASALVRKLQVADERLDFEQAELRASLKASGRINWVHFVDRGRTAIVVAELPRGPAAGESAFRYELTAVSVEGAGAAVRRTSCQALVKGGRGVLDGTGAFLLDGGWHLYDGQSLAAREPLQPPPQAHAVFVQGTPCWMRAKEEDGRWTLSDARTESVLRDEPLNTFTLDIGTGDAAREITLTASAFPTANPDVFAFCTGAGKDNEAQVVPLAGNGMINLPLPPQLRPNGNKTFVCPFDARLSANGATLLVRSGFEEHPPHALHVLDARTGAVLQKHEATGLLPAFTLAGAWIGRHEGFFTRPDETANCDYLGIVCAAWKDDGVTIGPGPGASSLIDFVEAWRRAQAIQSPPTPVAPRESAQGQAAPSAAGPTSESELWLESLRDRLHAASPEALHAHTVARQAHQRENSRWLGKKDWATVLKLYERALELGYPAEIDIKDVRKKMQGN